MKPLLDAVLTVFCESSRLLGDVVTVIKSIVGEVVASSCDNGCELLQLGELQL